MSTTASNDEQCKALTADGERCSRPAREDGFCHQHGPDDETVDDADDESTDEDESADGDEQEADEQEADEEEPDAESDGQDAESDEQDGEADESAAESADEDSDDRTAGGDEDTDMSSGESIQQTEIGQVRQKVQNTAEAVVGHPLDGIVSIDATDEGWRVAVEVIERKSVPDTQDILGRYEITLDDDMSVTGYQRTHRYRRDDMSHDI